MSSRSAKLLLVLLLPTPCLAGSATDELPVARMQAADPGPQPVLAPVMMATLPSSLPAIPISSTIMHQIICIIFLSANVC